MTGDAHSVTGNRVNMGISAFLKIPKDQRPGGIESFARDARSGARADGRASRMVGVRSGKIKVLFSQLMAPRPGR
ncbi:hypothetical protein ACFQ05_41050 [Amycolatopsis umgeniensis]|uniref:Uncharacterized protein n=1 Tax=Amycolatopsis umgeniensis TaxID=336628 RepID=A0A841BG17_9PSEU|nr:hypothetical protein [Amycolatopsis umgeniensis]MBB5857512.1 hypothetical protein [Amycolatopsis umgeniensis]